ncbi:MAG: intradiol ring-cleavage dioxygenase [Gammaproteobacteria bacterium]
MDGNRVKETPTARTLSRRELLALIGATAAAPLLGWAREQSTSQSRTSTPTQTPLQAAGAAAPSCVVRPQQTEGPYFVDEKLNRSDIRSDPSDGLVQPGVPLRLVFRISQIPGSSCSPLAGAVVDIWQCNALGVYSDFLDINGLFDTRGKKFLRGYQVTDARGKVEFITIYPGWYPGRTVHIHFKIRTDSASQHGHEFTSQLYFDESGTDQVHAQAPYASKGQHTLTNDRDRIFRDGGSQLMLQLTKDAQGYVGTFDIGLEMTG